MAPRKAAAGIESSNGQRFVFGEFEVDSQRACLTHRGEAIALRPKTYAMLLYLLEHAGQLVAREELLAALWPGLVVTDDSIAQCLIELRRALGDDTRSLIRTVPRRGLIFEVPVQVEDAAALSKAKPRLQSARTGWALAVGAAAVISLTLWWGVYRRPAEDLGAAPTPTSAAIAVLRFTDLSPAADNTWLADGLSEEILHRLAQSPSLRVIARVSSFAVEGQSAAAIAEQLDVSHVLEGSLRRQGDTVRVTARLIDAASSLPVWSQTYDRQLGDILALQEEIARAVAGSLEARLADAQHGPDIDPRAHALFLEGRYFYLRRAEGDLGKARQRYAEAVAISPGFARAWADLARMALHDLAELDSGRQPAADREALHEMLRHAAEQALRFGPDLPEAQVRAAQYYYRNGERERSLKHLQTARSLDPGHWLVQMSVVNDLRMAGRIEESIPLVRNEIQQDPLNPAWRENLVYYLVWAQRFEEAQAELDRALELVPSAAGRSRELNEVIPLLQILRGDFAAAADSIDALPEGVDRLQLLALTRYGQGLPAEADAALEQLVAGVRMPWGARYVAEVHAFRGESAPAMHWLNGIDWEPGCQNRRLAQLVYYSPFLAKLKGTPAWDEYRADLLQSMQGCSLGLEGGVGPT